MNKIRSYKAAGLLYKTDQLVEYFESHEEKKEDLPVAYRVRTSAFAVALLNKIGLIKEENGMLFTKVNDRVISVKTDPVKRILGDDYERVMKENLPLEKSPELNESKETKNVNADTAEKDSPDVIVSRAKINILKADSSDSTLPLDQKAIEPIERKENINNGSNESKDAEASIIIKADPHSSIIKKHTEKADSDKTGGMLSADKAINIKRPSVQGRPVGKMQEPKAKEPATESAKNNDALAVKPAIKKNLSQWMEINTEGIKNYVIPEPNHEEQEPRKAEEFLYDRYIITQPDKPEIRCLVFPVKVPEDGQQRCDIVAMADNGENIAIAASNNEAQIAMLKIGANTICISGFITDGVFTTSATFPGMKEKHVVKTEVRPASKDASIGHIVYKADKADVVHLFPAIMAADKNVVCPAFGVNYQTFGANKSITPFLSGKGDITVKCEKSRIRFITFWKNGAFGIKTEINPRG